MERTFDLYNERILLKFHRENGQIFCKTVEFFEPRTPAMIAENKEPELAESDVKVCKFNKSLERDFMTRTRFYLGVLG